MMKFFRKYNRHLLAVFMAGLLVIWLGQAALEDMLQQDQSGGVRGTSKYGEITGTDTKIVESQSGLLTNLSLAFRQKGQAPLPLSWSSRFLVGSVRPGEQLDEIDWVLLKREAASLGVKVSPSMAKRILLGHLGTNEKTLKLVAAKSDVVVDRFYEAYADVLAVEQLMTLFYRAAMPSEMTLRRTARNALERATVELVKLPANSFVDSGQSFSEEELTEQFNEFRDKHAVAGGVEFGYYVEPSIDLQYIRIDPSKVMEGVVSNADSIERQAFRYWQQNKETDPRFRISNERLAEVIKEQQAATSNGVTPPKLSFYIEDFAKARDAAVEAVKSQKAENEANRIATELARRLADPWFDIRVEKTEYKPAPDEVKSIGYYDEVIESVSVAKRHAGAIEVALIKDIDQKSLSETDGVGTASLEQIDGSLIPIDALAFNVEGLETIPDDENSADRSLFLSKWQTQVKPLVADDGSIYLFRVTEVRKGREPKNLDEVRDQVIADLQLKAGMERAKEAAESIAAKDTGGPLKDLWGGETDLQDQITPDQGGFAEPPAFTRKRQMREEQFADVDGVGRVSREFLDKAFELAADPDNSRAVAVELPAEAAWVVVKGKSFIPVYEETFASQKNQIRREVGSIEMQKLRRFEWLNKQKLHERTDFKRANQA